MAQAKVNSLVLRYADFSESSRMLTLFTLEQGKISVSAKGCRRPKSALRPLSELYTLSELLLSGREGRWTLTGGSLIDPFYDLRMDYERLNAASVLAQIANTVLPEEDPRPELFGLMARCLGLLAHEKLSPSLVSAYFALRVLALEGFSPNLADCSLCGAGADDAPYFSLREGGLLCAECARTVPDAEKITPGLLKTLCYLAAAEPDALTVFRLSPAIEAPLLDMAEAWLFVQLDRRISLRA